MHFSRLTYSVIMIAEEKAEHFESHIRHLHDFLSDLGQGFEIIIIANGTEGLTRERIYDINQRFAFIKIFTLYRKNTQAVCMKAALREAKGDIVIACGSYQQITMESLREALNHLDADTDMVLPCRRNRVDPPFNQLQSRLFNQLVRKITGYRFTDLSCTMRIVRRQVMESIDFYGNMYRFLPVVAARKGFSFKEVEADHFKEMGKTGFYSMSEYVTRLLDIFLLLFLVRYTKKPFRFFSVIGSAFLLLGMGTLGYVMMEKIFFQGIVGNNLLLIIGFLFMAVGIQSAGIGLLGEIITFAHGRKKKEYSVDRIVSSRFTGHERRRDSERRKVMERRNVQPDLPYVRNRRKI